MIHKSYPLQSKLHKKLVLRRFRTFWPIPDYTTLPPHAFVVPNVRAHHVQGLSEYDHFRNGYMVSANLQHSSASVHIFEKCLLNVRLSSLSKVRNYLDTSLRAMMISLVEYSIWIQ